MIYRMDAWVGNVYEGHVLRLAVGREEKRIMQNGREQELTAVCPAA